MSVRFVPVQRFVSVRVDSVRAGSVLAVPVRFMATLLIQYSGYILVRFRLGPSGGQLSPISREKENRSEITGKLLKE